MKKSNAALLVLIVLLALLGGLGGGYVINQYLQVYRTNYSEAGVSVKPTDFFKKGGEEAFFTHDSEEFQVNVPGKYRIRLQNGNFKFRSTLIIEDTIPPQATAVTVKKAVGSPVMPAEFVTDIEDATVVTLSFAEQPDMDHGGRQTVRVSLVDQGGNETILSAPLILSQAVEAITIEAGYPLPKLDDFVIAAETAGFVVSPADIDPNAPGTYPITLLLDGVMHESALNILDTEPPYFTVEDIDSFTGTPREAEDFVTMCYDISPVAFTFLHEPDLSYIGTQELTIIATDSAGNEASHSVNLTLQIDTEAPEIRVPDEFTAQTGDTIAYFRHAVALDNNPDGLEFTVDQSAVDISTPGKYKVVYTARDLAGNEASKTVTLIVFAKEYDVEKIYAKADEVIAGMITEGMTDREKLWAIYRYTINNIFFETGADRKSWEQAAYEGFFDRKGDCYVYAMTVKVLLDRAGIKNEDIEKFVTSRRHYWHLIDLGEGWYHFDTTPRPDHPTIFMWTDEELMAYSVEHGNSHRYDHDIYPSDGRPVN